MKYSSNSIPCFLFLLFFLSYNVNCQSVKTEDSTRVQHLTVAKEIMAAAGTCALITIDTKGQPRVRTMDPFLPDEDFTVWFGTNPKSRKVDEIKKNARVTLYYADPGKTGYVSIHGTAQLIDHPKEKEQHWKAEWEAFYQNKKTDYLLIKVVPIWLEVMSTIHRVDGDEKTWQPPRVEFNGH